MPYSYMLSRSHWNLLNFPSYPCYPEDGCACWLLLLLSYVSLLLISSLVNSLLLFSDLPLVYKHLSGAHSISGLSTLHIKQWALALPLHLQQRQSSLKNFWTITTAISHRATACQVSPCQWMPVRDHEMTYAHVPVSRVAVLVRCQPPGWHLVPCRSLPDHSAHQACQPLLQTAWETRPENFYSSSLLGPQTPDWKTTFLIFCKEQMLAVPQSSKIWQSYTPIFPPFLWEMSMPL